MRWGKPLFGIGLITVATLILLQTLPGSSDWGTGPRIGIGMVLLTLGFLYFALPLAWPLLARTTRPDDYKGGCPVGQKCSCGTFNFYPRQSCKDCGEPVAKPSEPL